MDKMTKVKRSLADLENGLKQQVSFLQCSAREFDRGLLDEAIRISVTIRVVDSHDKLTEFS